MSKVLFVGYILFALMVFKPVFSDNLYLQQIKQANIKKSDERLHQRIKKFQQKKRYIIKNLPSFHKQNEKKQQAETLCQMCHGRLPHSKNSNIRAFLNQHSQRIACLTCHYQPKNVTLKYIWSKPVTEQKTLNRKKPSKKIIPVIQGKSLIVSANQRFSQQIKKSWDEGDLYQKERLHQQIHQPLSKTKLNCNDCHQNKGFLDLQALAYTPEEINKIENNRISRFLSDLKPVDENNSGKNKQRILLRGLLQ